jgi:hypothetical protein
MAELQLISTLVNSMEATNLEQYAAIFMYQGFSPDLVFEHLAKIKKEKNISNSEFQGDMKSLIIMGIIMGNYNDNNSNKINPEGKVQGDMLVVKYDLKKGGIGTEKRAVNIPRILAAFSLVTSTFVLQLPPRNYSGVYNADSLNLFFKTSVCPSLIPKTFGQEVLTIFLHLCNSYLTEQTMAIRNMQNAKEAYNYQWRYTNVSHKSSVPAEEERKKHIRKITFSYAVLSDVVKNINTRHADTSAALKMPTREMFLKEGIIIT